MATTTLESMRQLYEDLDALQVGLAATISVQPATKKEAVLSEHVVAKGLVACQSTAQRVMKAHSDADGLRRAELATMTGPDMLDAFYAAVDDMQSFHKRHPGSQDAPSVMDALRPTVRFTGEEVHGRCLDLVAFHTRWLNVVEASPEALPYIAFLRSFASTREALADIPGAAQGDSGELLRSKAYRAYVKDLAAYLVDFHRRTSPLVSVAHLLAPVAAEASLTPPAPAAAAGSQAGAPSDRIDLSAHTSVSSLESLGGDALKAELAARGLKCGGSVAQRATRLLAVAGLAPADIPPKHRGRNFEAAQAAAALAPGPAVAAGSGEEEQETREGEPGEGEDAAAALDFVGDSAPIPHEGAFPAGTALSEWHEAVVRFMAETLANACSATSARVQRKATRTWDELRADAAAEEAGHAGGAEAMALAQAAAGGDSDSEEEAPIYNPKRVPLDWDGKPIPLWLYKLHGLRFAFECEVCGGTTYHGPKVFQQHFSQRTHAEGMRRLGVPNSAHFHGLSKIAEVQALWGKVQGGMAAVAWDAEEDEEFEDSAGNVMNRKTYEDLARQGML